MIAMALGTRNWQDRNIKTSYMFTTHTYAVLPHSIYCIYLYAYIIYHTVYKPVRLHGQQYSTIDSATEYCKILQVGAMCKRARSTWSTSLHSQSIHNSTQITL